MIKKIYWLFRKPIALIKGYLTHQQPHDKQKTWENLWAKPDFDIQRFPSELQEAVAQQWFAPASRLLDIGCGSGTCANWLAQQGFMVTGIDFAPSAIRRAQATYPEHEYLRFCLLDICQAAPARTFDALFDRGCFHEIPSHLRSRYVQHVAAAANPNAHVLLLHRLWATAKGTVPPDEQAAYRARLIAQIQRDFHPLFAVTDSRPIIYRRHGEQPTSDDLPGVAFWMVRR
ncbi:MAG: methyltransferase domain-containing protein [Caldilineaceae bacterium]